jgi:hypothetical protein
VLGGHSRPIIQAARDDIAAAAHQELGRGHDGAITSNEHDRRPVNDTATRIYCTSLRQGF